MAEFEVTPRPLEIPTSEPNGGSYKNIKEMKVGNGNFYVDASGKLELRDSSGNVVVVLDPNG